MIQKITNDVYKITLSSNIYCIISEKLLIDTGNYLDKNLVEKELSQIIDLSEIKKVIFTHLHFDHIGNFNLFPNAKFYVSNQELLDFKKNKYEAILNPVIAKKFNADLCDVFRMKLPANYKVIATPGHTRGSIAIYDSKNKILFSGDTLFFDGFGRVDMPTSDPKKMEKSLMLLEDLDFEILCPGHDY